MRYAYGGPIERDNTHVSPKATANRVLQKLGDIRFYSDETRTAPEGYLIAKDVNSNKDFGVLRNQDGTYRFYDPNKDRLIANSNSESKNFYKDYLNSAFYKSAYSGFSDTASVIESYKIPVKG